MSAVATYLKLRYLWPIFVFPIIYSILEILENLLTMDDDHSMHGGHAQHVAMDHGRVHGDDDLSVGAMNHDGKSIINYGNQTQNRTII